MSGRAAWGAVLLLSNAAIHAALAPMHLHEAPYAGVLFLAFAVACVGLAVALVVAEHPLTWAAVAALSGLGLVAYVATRLVAFPQLHDVGFWAGDRGLGYPTLALEALTIGLAAWALRQAMALEHTKPGEQRARPVSVLRG